MSHRPQPAALSRAPRRLFVRNASEAASFPEYAVNAWEKPHQFGATVRRYCRLYRAFFFVTLGFALFNLTVPWLGATISLGGNRGFILVVSLLAGAMIGEVAWLAVWTVFGPPPYKMRWAFSFFAVETLYLALFWALGEISGADWADFSIVAVLPLTLTSMQAPLWAWKFTSGYRLCTSDDETDSLPQRSQFRLLDILGLTATICVAGALASLWLQFGAKTHGTATSVIAICLSAVLVGAIAASVFAWTALATRRRMVVGSQLIYVVVATFFVAICSMGPVAPVNFRQFGSSLEYFSQVIAQSSFNSRFAMFWFLPCAACVLVFHAGVLAVRTCGYRLRRARSGTYSASRLGAPVHAAGNKKPMP